MRDGHPFCRFGLFHVLFDGYFTASYSTSEGLTSRIHFCLVPRILRSRELRSLWLLESVTILLHPTQCFCTPRSSTRCMCIILVSIRLRLHSLPGFKCECFPMVRLDTYTPCLQILHASVPHRHVMNSVHTLLVGPELSH